MEMMNIFVNKQDDVRLKWVRDGRFLRRSVGAWTSIGYGFDGFESEVSGTAGPADCMVTVRSRSMV